jgi:FkbM family methyltransferase
MMDKIYLAEWKVLQSFCRNHYTPEGLKWTPGDFIAHFTGEAVDIKLDLFKKCTGGDIGKCAYERIMGFGTMEDVYCMQVGAHIGNSPNDALFVQDLSDKNIILIEPVPYLFEQLKENYKTKAFKNAIGLNLAVSNFNGTLDLYVPSQRNDFTRFPYWVSQLSSTREENITKQTVYRDGTPSDVIIDKITVQCFSLNTIIEEMNIKSIEILLIDAEGHDYEILMDLDFDKIKPKRIVFEIKHIDGVLNRGGLRYRSLLIRLLSYGYMIIHIGEDDIIVELKK